MREDTVTVAAAPALPTGTEGALKAQVGAGVPSPVTLQESDTVPE